MKFCRVLTQAVAEDFFVRFGMELNFKQLKTSQLAAVASAKQPKTLPNLVHELSGVVPIRNIPVEPQFALQGKQQLKREQVLIHKGWKVLRRTEKGGASKVLLCGTAP